MDKLSANNDTIRKGNRIRMFFYVVDNRYKCRYVSDIQCLELKIVQINTAVEEILAMCPYEMSYDPTCRRCVMEIYREIIVKRKLTNDSKCLILFSAISTKREYLLVTESRHVEVLYSIMNVLIWIFCQSFHHCFGRDVKKNKYKKNRWG